MISAPIDTAREAVTTFASIIFEPGDIIEFRCIKPRDGKAPLVKQVWDIPANAPRLINSLRKLNDEGYGIYAGANPRPAKNATGDACIKLARAVFVDFDGTNEEDAHDRVLAAGLPEPHLMVFSGHGAHSFWRLAEPCTDLNAWRNLQADLADLLGTDAKVKNPERVMRLPGFMNLKADPVQARVVYARPDESISFDELRRLVPHVEPTPPPIPHRRHNGNGHDREDKRLARAAKYIDKMPSAIAGQGGHDATFAVACETQRFGLDDPDAWGELVRFNGRCEPPWSERELRHKLDQAKKVSAAEFGSRLEIDDPPQRAKGNGSSTAKDDNGQAETSPGEPDIIDPANPRENAKRVLFASYSHPDRSTLLYDGGEFFAFTSAGKYEPHAVQAVRENTYQRFEHSQKIITVGENERVVRVKPNKAFVDNIYDAIKARTFVNAVPPCWLTDDANLPPAKDLIPARNGLYRFDGRGLMRVGKTTPNLYATHALDYDVMLDAMTPAEWLKFLKTIFGDDEIAVGLLQEWFGLCLTSDTSQQKLLLMVGPKRSGKGTIARVLTALIGAANVCAPTLAGLGTNFGLMALIGKLVAIISDARLSGRTDLAVIVERLLAITGEDAITIDRKNIAPITLRLLTRFVILTNELPRLSDASGALANRCLILQLTKSFLGREDTSLTDRLLLELPGILLWSVQGLKRVRERGHFLLPASSAQMLAEMEDLSSPVGAFVRDWCRVGIGGVVACDDLFSAWCVWSREQGNNHPGTKQVFGRDLRAVLPEVQTAQPRTDDGRERVYEGIRLTEAAAATLATERAKQADRDKSRPGGNLGY